MKKQDLPYITFALISECVLNFKTGLVNYNGSPFRQLSELHPELELRLNNKKQALLDIHDKLSTYRLPGTLYREVQKIRD